VTLPPDWQQRSDVFQNNFSVKRKVFVSYHHELDQFWFDLFTKIFSDDYEVFQDQSLDGAVDSEDLEYVNRAVREDHIKGTSITIVLCGAETWKRKFIDWEIASTLHLEHALLGLLLPGTLPGSAGKYLVPDRLHDNIQTGYASFERWPDTPQQLKTKIESALNKSLYKFLIRNERFKMTRNL